VHCIDVLGYKTHWGPMYELTDCTASPLTPRRGRAAVSGGISVTTRPQDRRSRGRVVTSCPPDTRRGVSGETSVC